MVGWRVEEGEGEVHGDKLATPFYVHVCVHVCVPLCVAIVLTSRKDNTVWFLEHEALASAAALQTPTTGLVRALPM